MPGCPCACPKVAPDLALPLSSEMPAGFGQASGLWYVWSEVVCRANELQVSPPAQLRGPDDAAAIVLTVVSTDGGAPQLTARVTGAVDDTWVQIGSPANITTLGQQVIGPVSGITYPLIRLEIQSTSGMSIIGLVCFWIWHA